MLELVIAVLISITGALSYSVYNLLRTNEIQEDIINACYRRVELAMQLMRMFDRKQMFEHDDEVGETFNQLKICTDELYAYVTEFHDDAETPTQQETN